MRETVLSQAQEALLKRCAEIGGCVDYVLLNCDMASGGDVSDGVDVLSFILSNGRIEEAKPQPNGEANGDPPAPITLRG